MVSLKSINTLPGGWRKVLAPEFEKQYFKNLSIFISAEVKNGRSVYPAPDKIFAALELVDFGDVRVVILGQDPYHGPNQAVGLSFAVPNSHFPKPPSLKNIYKEIESDLGCEVDKGLSDLTGWAEQGVLLLNTVLTVEGSKPMSHRNRGWEVFTDAMISALNDRELPVIFILWGAAAQTKKALITHKRHLFLESVHPSPLSAYRGFFGSRHFSKANHILKTKLGLKPIDWAQISNKLN